MAFRFRFTKISQKAGRRRGNGKRLGYLSCNKAPDEISLFGNINNIHFGGKAVVPPS